MGLDVGERFIDALIDGDFAGLGACLDEAVRMRALVPSGPREVGGRAAATDLLRRWFGEADTRLPMARTVEPLADRTHLSWRVRLHGAGGWRLIEQHAYADVTDGRISRLDLLCSGFHPEPAAGGTTFDAGSMGCADGLAAEFRRRIDAVRPGGLLTVHTADPGARRDLPALARMLGHTVTTTETHPDGSVSLTVERRG